MYKKQNISNVQFVESKGECGFREVVDDFINAEYINILTFDISKNSDELLNLLKIAGKRDIPITLISNIPQRFETYFSSSSYDYRNSARKNIKIYERKLNPESIGRLAEVFFMFENHGKIVMTNNIIYWGSANFSDESKRNYECGVLCRDVKFIEYVNTNVFPSLIANSVSYYAEEYTVCLASLLSVLTYLHNKFDEIHDASYGIYSDYGTGFQDKEYFDMYDNYISWRMLTELVESIRNAADIIRILQDTLDCNEDEYDDLEILRENYETYMESQADYIEKLCYQLEEMTKFDEEDYANNLINGKYGVYSDEENLDYYAQLAFEEGREVMQGYIEEAEPIIRELLEALDGMDEMLLDFVSKVTNIAKINEEIDNT